MILSSSKTLFLWSIELILGVKDGLMLARTYCPEGLMIKRVEMQFVLRWRDGESRQVSFAIRLDKASLK